MSRGAPRHTLPAPSLACRPLPTDPHCHRPALPCPALPQVIENFELFRRLFNLEEEDEAALGAAQAIIARLRRRELYKYVTDALIPQVGWATVL